jgi:putative peptidoglycan lipid II flippase
MTTDSAPAALSTSTTTQSETNAGVARATGVLALGSIASRMLGLVREITLTNLFGASAAIDAFNVAVIIPKALYDLLIAGHVNSAIIPVLSEVEAAQGRRALWQVVSILLSLVSVLLALLVLLLELFAPNVVRFVGSGFGGSTLNLASDLLRLTAPALLFLSWFSVLSGTLYALRMFTWPAFAGAGFNGAIVLGTILLIPAPQLTTVISTNGISWSLNRPANAIMAAAAGWLIGSLVQFAMQLLGLREAQLRLTLNWRHPAIRQIIRLYTPVMFSLILDALVIRTFSYNLASQSVEGSTGYMNWATTLIQFPQGLVATAISIAILPTLSRQAALITPEGRTAFRDTLGLGLRLAATLILPATVALFVLATPIVALLFEHGAFTARDTVITVSALRLYLIGLPFAALDLLLVYAFYARQDTLTPAVIGLLSLTVYMLVAITLFPRVGLFSLMIADSVKHLTHALVSAYLLARRMNGLGRQRLVLTFSKAGIAAVGMGIIVTLVMPTLTREVGTRGLVRETLLVAFSGAISVLTYLALALSLGLEELRWLWGLIWQRVKV